MGNQGGVRDRGRGRDLLVGDRDQAARRAETPGRTRRPRMILGIIVFQDVFMALYLAMLQPILRGAEGAGEMAFEFGTCVPVPHRPPCGVHPVRRSLRRPIARCRGRRAPDRSVRRVRDPDRWHRRGVRGLGCDRSADGRTHRRRDQRRPSSGATRASVARRVRAPSSSSPSASRSIPARSPRSPSSWGSQSLQRFS